MGTITSLFARKFLNAADASIDRDAWLRSLGIQPEGQADPAHMVPDTEYYAFLERLAGADADPSQFRRYGSARRLYHFDIDNAGAY